MENTIVMTLARMPLCTAGEISGLLGLDEDGVRACVRSMREYGSVGSLYVGQLNGERVQRHYLQGPGVEALSKASGRSVERLIADGYPLTTDWMRTILHRIGNAQLFYGMSVAASRTRSFPCLWHWRRRGWHEGTVKVGPELFLRVARVGRSASRSAVKSKLGSLVESWKTDSVDTAVVIAPDHTTAKFIEGWLRAGASGVYVWVGSEADALRGDLDANVWVRPLADEARYRSFRQVVGNVREAVGPGKEMGVGIERYKRAALMPGDGAESRRFRKDRYIAEASHALRVLLDVLADWPLATRADLQRLSGYGQRSVELAMRDGAERQIFEIMRLRGQRRYVLGDGGLKILSWNDRTQLKALRAEWGLSPGAGSGVERLRGSKLNMLAKHLQHTEQLYEVMSSIVQGCRELPELELQEALPPHRSERWATQGRRLVGMRPDASGVISLVGRYSVPFLLEYERRADSPATMSSRLDPYRRFYDGTWHKERWKAPFATFVVYEDAAAAGRFVVHCRRDPDVPTTFLGLRFPIYVSSLEAMRKVGAAGACWMNSRSLDRGAMTLVEVCESV